MKRAFIKRFSLRGFVEAIKERPKSLPDPVITPDKDDLNKLNEALSEGFKKMPENLPDPEIFRTKNSVPNTIGYREICNIEGKINMYTPYLTLIPIMGRLNNWDLYNFVKASVSESVSGQKMLSYALEEVTVPWMIEFGRTRKALKEIQEIKKGDHIKLDNLAGSPFEIFVGNIRIGQGEIDYLYNDIFGMRIVLLEEEAPGNTLPCLCGPYNMNIPFENLNDMNINLSAVLDRGILPVKNIKKLQEGKTFELQHFNGEHMELFAGGIHIGSGEAVVIDNHFGIRITRLEGQNV